MLVADKWKDYILLDAAHGEKVEFWKDIKLRRPDPQAIWQEDTDPKAWNNLHAHYHRSSSGGGSWQYYKKIPESWHVNYENLTIKINPMGFKQTGLFPEQAVTWEFIMKNISAQNRPVNVLNLFAYTGGATVAAASAGAKVVHVDASKGMVSWAKENAASSGLADAPIRYIVDDVIKFVEREKRRGNKYDCIIMDPPSYGRGPKGEIWKFEDEFYSLVCKCMDVLSDDPLFFIVNSYTTGISPSVVSNVLKLTIGKKFGGHVMSDEIGLPIKSSNLVLPCGLTSRWYSDLCD